MNVEDSAVQFNFEFRTKPKHRLLAVRKVHTNCDPIRSDSLKFIPTFSGANSLVYKQKQV